MTNRHQLRKVRPRRWPSRIVGLTGSIAMGKSTATDFLARAGIPVFSADTAVHHLLGPRGLAVGAVAARFPGVAGENGVDRAALGKAVFGKPDDLAALEAILHPMVKAKRAHFFQTAALRRHAIVAVEIPLLFETPQSAVFDMIVVVSAPAFLQRQRALRRPGIAPARLAAILARQMPDAEKTPPRRRGHSVRPRQARDLAPTYAIPQSTFGLRQRLQRMREIVLDTETTGLDPFSGHRVVEIGCVELLNHMPTGKQFDFDMNPERDMPAEAEAVHGLSASFLSDKPLFSSLADDLLGFIGDLPDDRAQCRLRCRLPSLSLSLFLSLSFSLFLPSFSLSLLPLSLSERELRRAGKAPLTSDRTIDTVMLARRKFPCAPASLDALCRRFQIDLSERGKHGALLDAKLLAKVYLELVGGREPGLALASGEAAPAATLVEIQARIARAPRPHEASEDELAAHTAFIAKLKNPIWTRSEEAPAKSA